MAKNSSAPVTVPASDANKPPKVPKVRSPNYPVIDLGKALERSKAIYDSYRTTPVSFKIVAEKLDYKVDSSIAAQTVAALRAYGLVSVDGSGDDRKVAVTDSAMKMILDHPSRPELLRVSALAPRIHRELWDKFYEGKATPDPDDLIRNYLQWERPEGKFNHEAIGPFLSQFKRTIAFAKVDSSAKMSLPAPETDPEEGRTGGQKDAGMVAINPNTSTARKDDPPAPPGSQTATMPLDSGETVMVRWPARMSTQDLQDVEDWLEIVKRKIARSAKDDDADQTE